jgi:hypothetical protein
VAGGVLTYTLTFDRERRRSAEGYRAPQRQAVADVLRAIYEMDTRAKLCVEAMGPVIKDGADSSGQPLGVDPERIASAIHDFRAAADELGRAYQLARIVLVDAQCREALNGVHGAFTKMMLSLRTPNPKTHLEASQYRGDLIAAGQRVDIAGLELANAAEHKLGPVASLWRRRRRNGVVPKVLSHSTLSTNSG